MLDNNSYSAHRLAELVSDTTDLASIDAFVEKVFDTCHRADELLRSYYSNPDAVDVSQKADDSPVTAADHASHECWVEALAALTPSIPVLSEESTAAELEQRRQWQRLWVLDPLDGTKEFIARTGEFTINLALVDEERPVLGLISVPMQRLWYLGIPGVGAWRFRSAEGLRNPTTLKLTDFGSNSGVTLLASARHHPGRVSLMMTQLEPLGTPVSRENAGSALKFCRMLDGDGDVYPRTSPCYEWDVAAGDALVSAAGGAVTTYAGEPLRYNCRDTLLVDDFIAVADPTVDYLSVLADEHGNRLVSPKSGE
ncbi:3'(2'),5'-bisphosphate nucleotidase [Luminiphilus syltensis NOR5-1B]|uniref:3'(2'),5'-bisphosphate nucleotidase CysQ n=1 Tax=Luminiphilus syltensis NOR5-1B TaxID=565045 RepID=B8KWC3_9GAMM|nr:3'(2'),5'-bisphosphate nucleotidase CysQ [Luminiphilus syltensis]EED34662.1 3'(2'),5'-bisphosphate nucleotidase [Luminiphilus syltensis NOR5-1B]